VATVEPDASAVGVLRPVGQVQDGYVLAESAAGLVLVDQHAAHERILFNQLLETLRSGLLATQPLLVPEVLELGRADALALDDNLENLARFGFQVERFGMHTARVLAAPASIPAARVADACLEVLSTLNDGTSSDRDSAVAASLACHSAVRFGDALDPAEQRALLADLELAQDALTCPHGRPTRLLLDWQEVKRHFRRNY
jgi:DNA mismatch repair protein MutL